MNTTTLDLSVEDIVTATTQLRTLRQKMSFVVSPTEEERRTHFIARGGADKLRAIKLRLDQASQHRDLLPSSFDLKQFEQDIASAMSLYDCATTFKEVAQEVYDTYLTVAGRAAAAAAFARAHLNVGLGHRRPARKPKAAPSEVSAPPTPPTVLAAPGDATPDTVNKAA